MTVLSRSCIAVCELSSLLRPVGGLAFRINLFLFVPFTLIGLTNTCFYSMMPNYAVRENANDNRVLIDQMYCFVVVLCLIIEFIKLY